MSPDHLSATVREGWRWQGDSVGEGEGRILTLIASNKYGYEILSIKPRYRGREFPPTLEATRNIVSISQIDTASASTPVTPWYLMSNNPKKNQDVMPEIIRIVRDAIDDGLIRGETPSKFRYKVKTLKGKELEDYIQRLWDRV